MLRVQHFFFPYSSTLIINQSPVCLGTGQNVMKIVQESYKQKKSNASFIFPTMYNLF